MPEDVKTPISKVLLKENDNLSLIFPTASENVYEMYFFRVMRSYPLNMIYTKIDSLDPNEEVEYATIGENGLNSGDDIFDKAITSRKPFRILHFGIGVKPGGVWVYKAMPPGTPQTAFAFDLPTSVGDEKDYFDADLSPFDDPTIASETVIYRKMSLNLGFKNVNARPVKPILRFFGKGYDVMPISDTTFIEKMLAGIKPVRYITVGGLRYFTYTVPKEWDEYKVTVDKATVEELMRSYHGGGK